MVIRIPNSRTIILADEVNRQTSIATVIELLNLAGESDDDITLFINSPGGSITDGLAIYDVMNYIKPDVCTIVMGLAASMGAFLLCCGTKGKRYALPNAEIMIHQPLGGTGLVQQTNLQIVAEHLAETREILESIMSKQTGQPIAKIHQDCERDNYMTAQEALEYGLIDKILTHKN
jgi:ATP-dependent Clp protease protease subunit